MAARWPIALDSAFNHRARSYRNSLPNNQCPLDGIRTIGLGIIKLSKEQWCAQIAENMGERNGHSFVLSVVNTSNADSAD